MFLSSLQGVVTLIFDKAVLEPTFCTMYSQLFSDLNAKLPPFPSDEPGGKEITFKRVLLNNCQEAFEGAANLREEARQMTSLEQESERKDKEKLIKLRTLGNIQLIGEIFKLRMVRKNIIHGIVKVFPYCYHLMLLFLFWPLFFSPFSLFSLSPSSFFPLLLLLLELRYGLRTH